MTDAHEVDPNQEIEWIPTMKSGGSRSGNRVVPYIEIRWIPKWKFCTSKKSSESKRKILRRSSIRTFPRNGLPFPDKKPNRESLRRVYSATGVMPKPMPTWKNGFPNPFKGSKLQKLARSTFMILWLIESKIANEKISRTLGPCHSFPRLFGNEFLGGGRILPCRLCGRRGSHLCVGDGHHCFGHGRMPGARSLRNCRFLGILRGLFPGTLHSRAEAALATISHMP